MAVANERFTCRQQRESGPLTCIRNCCSCGDTFCSSAIAAGVFAGLAKAWCIGQVLCVEQQLEEYICSACALASNFECPCACCCYRACQECAALVYLASLQQRRSSNHWCSLAGYTQHVHSTIKAVCSNSTGRLAVSTSAGTQQQSFSLWALQHY